MNRKKKSVIGITMGDPSGIGPEIILKCFEKPSVRNKKVLVIGDYDVMIAASALPGIRTFSFNRVEQAGQCRFDPGVLNILDLHLMDMKEFRPGIVSAMSGNAAFHAIKKAVELAEKKEIDAIVTAPLNKEALHLAGHNYPGHTEILAGLTGTTDYAMFLHDRKLSVIHVSTHLSLMDAVSGLKRERIEKVIMLADDVMKKLGISEPRIAVAGMNPHAGENGLFGREEIEIIAPAIRSMKQKGLNVEGPCPPDTVFLQAIKGRYDIVVAMYHDQGHIPLKLLGFNTGVNVTAGLPFVRTSVDHGTAFEIAWKGVASERSMTEAVRLAVKLS
jgi:4-hydroxythreonine-4-phosphate dehydrogenase